jgi:hypothetical protein
LKIRRSFSEGGPKNLSYLSQRIEDPPSFGGAKIRRSTSQMCKGGPVGILACRTELEKLQDI